MKSVIALLFLVVLVKAQKPERCETPKTWEGRQVMIDEFLEVSVYAKISYDAHNERIRLVEAVDVKKERKFFDFILLYGEDTMYQIELSTNGSGACVKKRLGERFHAFEIPYNATALDSLTIGTNADPGAGVNVNVFVGEIEGARYMVTVTDEDCLPVHEVMKTEKSGTIFTSFYDIELGVDPEVFVPPPQCNEVV